MIEPIVIYGNEILKQKSIEIELNSNIGSILVDDLFETLENHKNGVGLAAPQINQSYRVFVINTTTISNGIKKEFINPKILWRSADENSFKEGCLSVPGILVKIFRPQSIKIEYFDKFWKKHIEDFSEIEARVIQHEYDHLDGILHVDLAGPIDKMRIRSKLEKFKRNS